MHITQKGNTKMKNRVLFLVLAMCMVVGVFAGCSGYDNYDLDKYITLGQYSQIEILESAIVADITSAYESMSSADKKEVTYSEAEKNTEGILVEDKDKVNIDYVGKVDGKEFEGGSAKGSDLTIGSGTFIDDFEEQLIGYEIGETVIVNVTFPEDYGKEELRNKDAEFTVKINSLKRTVYPEYNDENVKKYSKDAYATVAEFEAEQRDQISKSLVWEKVIENAKVSVYPKKELKEYYDRYIEEYKATASYYTQLTGKVYTLETIATTYGYKDLKAFFADILSTAKSQVKSELIVYALMEKEFAIKMTDAEYDKAVEELWNDAKESGSYTESLKQFKKDADKEALYNQVYKDRVQSFLLSLAIIKDDVTKNGLVTDRKGTKYYIDNVLQTGWQNVDVDGDGTADKCYFNATTGYLAIGGAYAKPEDGSETELFYDFGEKGVFVGIYNGFHESSAGIRYFDNGVAYKGDWYEIEIDGEMKSFFFFESTYAATGDVTVTDPDDAEKTILGRFTDKGVYEYELIGWITTDAGTRYYYVDTENEGKVTYATGAYEIEGYTYFFFGSEGYLVGESKAEFVVGDYFAADCGDAFYLFKKVTVGEKTLYAIATDYTDFFLYHKDAEGETPEINNTYYFEDGKGQFGWKKIGTDIYYFGYSDGVMYTGEKTIKDVAYTFGTDGKLTTVLNGLVYDENGCPMLFENNEFKTGKQTVENVIYYFGTDGKALNGWITEGENTKAYFAKDYKLLVGVTETIDGVQYSFDAEGGCTVVETEEEGGGEEGSEG